MSRVFLQNRGLQSRGATLRPTGARRTVSVGSLDRYGTSLLGLRGTRPLSWCSTPPSTPGRGTSSPRPTRRTYPEERPRKLMLSFVLSFLPPQGVHTPGRLSIESGNKFPHNPLYRGCLLRNNQAGSGRDGLGAQRS